MVRLKEDRAASLSQQYEISIPYGAIKSPPFLRIRVSAALISIPYGAIKRHANNIETIKAVLFQFLMVRLKE